MEKRIVKLVLILLCLSFTAPLFAKEPISISIIKLIANSDKYHGKFVRIFGYVELEFEGTAIYLSKEDADKHLSKNGLWLDLAEAVKCSECRNKFCLIEGIFNSEHKGHFNQWSGSLEKITRFEVWQEQVPK
ncbi:MAG: hypothetical protein ABIA97_04420 [Candidatus Omnitrophota bacterium]